MKLDRFGFGAPERKEKPYLITTTRRAFAGWADLRLLDGPGKVLWHVRSLRNARVWGVDNGSAELATKGPGCSPSREAVLDDYADSEAVTDIMVIRPLSPEAVERWGI